MATELSGHGWKFNISWTVCLLTFAVSTVKLGHTAAVEPNPVRWEFLLERLPSSVSCAYIPIISTVVIEFFV